MLNTYFRGKNMSKNILKKSVLLSMAAFMVIGCGTGVDNKTPEKAYESFIHLQAEGEIDKEISMVSKQSLKEQGIDVTTLQKSYEEIYKNLKFNDYKVIGINIVKTISIDEANVILEAQVKYTTNEKSEAQTMHEIVALKLEEGVWNISPNGYIKTYPLGNKCGKNGGIQICLSTIRYYADEIDVEASIKNSNSNDYAFGFAQPSGMALLFGDKEGVEGTHPRLQDMRKSNGIPVGKSNTVFIFGNGSQIFTPKEKPTVFGIDKIISMNGALPASFDEGLTIKVHLQ